MWTPGPQYTIVSVKPTREPQHKVKIEVEVTGFTDGDKPELWLLLSNNDTPATRFQEHHPHIHKGPASWQISATFKLHEVDHGKKFVAAVGLLDATGETGSGVGSNPFTMP